MSLEQKPNEEPKRKPDSAQTSFPASTDGENKNDLESISQMIKKAPKATGAKKPSELN